MMEMVKSTLMEEAVSGAASFVFSTRNPKTHHKDLMERLEMAHIKLHLGLERTRMMPITIMPLVRLRKKLKDVFKECDDLLSKARNHRQMVPSLRRKIMHVVLPSFIVPNQDVLSCSIVARIEWFAMEAEKFAKDVEPGRSLSHYRFLNPLTRHLLEDKVLSYHMVQGSRTCCLLIWTACVEEYGRVAWLDFRYKDRKAPLKSFELFLALRLYESTNIVGVTAKCLQSLGPQFKYSSEVAVGELTQVPTQDVSYSDLVNSAEEDDIVGLTTWWSPDPFCCIQNGLNNPCGNDIISSEFTDICPKDVMFIRFGCSFSAYEYCSRSSTDEVCIDTIKAWPPLEMSIFFAPHLQLLKPDDGSSLQQTDEEIQKEAIDYFIRHPELMQYDVIWGLEHGWAAFELSKPITKTRRVSKRRL